jgi:DNA-binding beta-propeller fold protein YncE
MRPSRTAFRVFAPLGVALVLGRCSDSGETHLEPDELLTIVASPTSSDTITSRPLQAVVVALRTESGAPNPDVIVQFRVVDAALAPPQPNMFLRPLDGEDAVLSLAVPTDSRGQAAVQVQFGMISGPGRIQVDVPELGLTQTLGFTVQAGNAATVVAAPRDTTVTVGSAPRITATATDRFGNARPDPVVFQGESDPAGAATVGASGVITPSAPGHLRVIASAGSVEDTVFLGILPTGAYVSLSIDGLIYRNLDGTNRRILRGAGSVNAELEPAWTPDGKEVVVTPTLSNGRIDFLDLTGAISIVTWASPPTDAYWPAVSPDGQYVYYTSVSGGLVTGLSRIKRDGSSPPEEVLLCECFRPTLSPTGRFVAYHAQTGDVFGVAVLVYDLQTRQHVGLPVPGIYPEWSPDGSVIAYYEIATERIRLFEPGGMRLEYITPPDRLYYAGQMSWSSDGRWFIARRSSGLDLIEVATRMVIPLWNTADARNPAFQP